MGTVFAEITIKNVNDEGKASEGIIRPEAIRAVTVQALVDTGAMTLVINEELRNELGLGLGEERTATVANGQVIKCHRADPVNICWKDRSCVIRPLVVPGAAKVLFGVIPLEDMDLMVNPVSLELVGVHGDEWQTMIM